jgi:hypothetical protein
VLWGVVPGCVMCPGGVSFPGGFAADLMCQMSGGVLVWVLLPGYVKLYNDKSLIHSIKHYYDMSQIIINAHIYCNENIYILIYIITFQLFSL